MNIAKKKRIRRKKYYLVEIHKEFTTKMDAENYLSEGLEAANGHVIIKGEQVTAKVESGVKIS